MTVQTQVAIATGSGNGSTTVFSFSPFVVFAASELDVTLVTAAGIETPLSEGTGDAAYSVTIASLPGTGSITYPEDAVTPIASGVKVVMKRVLVLEQQTDLENQGGYFPEVQEDQFDKLVMMVMQVQEELDRAITIPIGDISAVTSLQLPVPVAGKTFEWDPTAKFLIEASSPSAAAAAAVVSAAAALVSENAAAADAILTAADVVSTAADVVSTAADAVSTDSDATDTGVDAVATAADLVLTNADVVTAAASASAAASSASTATTQATAAQSSEDDAQTSEDAAATSETNAATSETNAATSASSAAASFDSFDDRYLGAKTSDPTLDNDSNALLEGALYFNSTADNMRVYDGAAWIVIDVLGTGDSPTFTGLTLTAGLQKSLTDAITANTTQDQANATALTTDLNRVTISANDGDGVKLPTAVAGRTVLIENADAAQTIQIWPNTSDTIDGGSADAVDGTPLVAGDARTYYAVSAVDWVTIPSIVAAQTAKLAAIEAAADVTDTTNVLSSLVGGAIVATSINFGDEALSVYDENISLTAFTPTIAFGGNATGVTYANQNGTYLKIGRIVWIRAKLTLTSNGSSTGSCTVLGLPFTVANVSGERMGVFTVSDLENINLGTNYTQHTFGAPGNSTTISLNQIGDNVGLAATQETDVADNARFDITGWYLTT